MRTSFICILCAAIICAPLYAKDRKITINPTISYQRIDNFTAADAWSGNFVGKYWAEKEKSQIAEWLFSQECDEKGNPKGIGLSLWRVNTGAGTWEQTPCDIQPLQRRAESFKTTDGLHYDWGKCAGQIYFMRKAKKLGCNNFLLFSNSPLVQYTLNGKGYSDTNRAANIRPECYDLYGDYLATVADHLQQEGLHISYISPINEPQVDWIRPTQEGSPWKKSEMKKMFVALDKAMSTRPSLANVKIAVGECASVPVVYQETAAITKQFGQKQDAPHNIARSFFDKNSPHYIGNLKHVPNMICGHSYHNHMKNANMLDVRSKVKGVCDSLGIAYQQTEWCLLPYSTQDLRKADGFTSDWEPGNYGDIQVALLMGRLIHTDLVHAGAEAWGYWKGMELNGNHALVALHAKDGNIFNGGTVSANKILWALGNYSRFVRPGYQRISTKGADDLNNVAASAFRSPDEKRIVLVLVNSGHETEDLELNLPSKYRRRISSTSVYCTDETRDLALTNQWAEYRKRISVAPRSLTTIVLEMKVS